MPRQIALIICILFILWLFYRDRKLRPMTSAALWIPFLAILMLGSRAVSSWFGAGIHVENLDDYLDGSPFDRNVGLVMLAAGMAIFTTRWTQCWNIIKENRLFFLFFAFCGISCLWSDYAFTAFKRYTKDLGNLIMVLIILSEVRPREAIRAVLARYVYVALPISLVLMYYFPEFGRYYNRWTGSTGYSGITTEKNALGQIAFVCGIFIVWDILEILSNKDSSRDNLDLLIRFILLTMAIWILYMAHSSTAILCMVSGTVILIIMRTSFFKNQVKNLGTWLITLILIAVIISSVPDLFASVVELLGRDTTLTGRTDLWMELLAQPFNPVLGYGYQSFWQTPEAARLGEKFYFIPNQAHNGYLEVYIQTGVISLLLLTGAIVVAGRKLKNGLLMNNGLSKFFFPFYILILISNWTEATINKMGIPWFILMLIILYMPKDAEVTPEYSLEDGITKN